MNGSNDAAMLLVLGLSKFLVKKLPTWSQRNGVVEWPASWARQSSFSFTARLANACWSNLSSTMLSIYKQHVIQGVGFEEQGRIAGVECGLCVPYLPCRSSLLAELVLGLGGVGTRWCYAGWQRTYCGIDCEL